MTGTTSALDDLTTTGVSIWLDDLSRDRIVSGGLQKLIDERHVVGVTTNPTIFATALAKGESYDAQVAELAAAGPDITTALLDHLAATDGVAGAIATGDTWGRTLAASVTGAGQATPDQPVDQPINVVLRVLDRLGFDPRRAASSSANGADDTAVVLLDTCPFLELVGPHPDLVCALHAGMIRSVLRTAGAPDGEAVLEPLGAPTACVARLRLRSPAARGASTPATGRRPGNQRPTRLP